jgi:hypothetical protein
MLKVALLSTLATWAVLALMIPGAIFLTGMQGRIAELWARAAEYVAQPQLTIALMAGILLLVVWTWKRRVDSLYLGLTGRNWLDGTIAAICLPFSVGLPIFAAWLKNNPDARQVFFDLLPWLLGVAIAVRLAAAAWALRVGLRRHLIASTTVRYGAAVWLIVALLLFSTLRWALPLDLVPTWCIAFAVLFALPMARLAASPLVLDWNRHR